MNTQVVIEDSFVVKMEIGLLQETLIFATVNNKLLQLFFNTFNYFHINFGYIVTLIYCKKSGHDIYYSIVSHVGRLSKCFFKYPKNYCSMQQTYKIIAS